MSASKTVFPALNGLRFWAALLVVIHHIEQTKMFFGYPHIFKIPFIDNIGSIGVSLFFVLSGFLITYLLLQEQKDHSRIHLGRFYMRRILRIWPLYYGVVLLAFFVLPYFYLHFGWDQNFYANFSFKLMLYVLILPNVCLALFPEVLAANQLWSIGVEEQFYLVWPLLVVFFRRNLLWVFAAILAGKSLLHVGLNYVTPHGSGLGWLNELVHQFEIEKLTIGSIGAYLLFNEKKEILRLIYHPMTQAVGWVGLLGFAAFHVQMNFYSTVLGFLMLIVLMNMCRRTHFWTDHPWVSYMGKTSYSMYMLHQFIILAVLSMAKQRFKGASFQVVMYAASLPLTALVSIASYELLEKPFLRLKTRFDVMQL